MWLCFRLRGLPLRDLSSLRENWPGGREILFDMLTEQMRVELEGGSVASATPVWMPDGYVTDRRM